MNFITDSSARSHRRRLLQAAIGILDWFRLWTTGPSEPHLRLDLCSRISRVPRNHSPAQFAAAIREGISRKPRRAGFVPVGRTACDLCSHIARVPRKYSPAQFAATIREGISRKPRRAGFVPVGRTACDLCSRISRVLRKHFRKC